MTRTTQCTEHIVSNCTKRSYGVFSLSFLRNPNLFARSNAAEQWVDFFRKLSTGSLSYKIVINIKPPVICLVNVILPHNLLCTWCNNFPPALSSVYYHKIILQFFSLKFFSLRFFYPEYLCITLCYSIIHPFARITYKQINTNPWWPQYWHNFIVKRDERFLFFLVFQTLITTQEKTAKLQKQNNLG